MFSICKVYNFKKDRYVLATTTQDDKFNIMSMANRFLSFQTFDLINVTCRS